MLSTIDTYQKEINSHRPFESPLLEQIKAYYRVSLTYTSNAIEGYAYSEPETKVLLEDGLTAGGKSLRDALAVVGHAKACDYMFTLLQNSFLANHDILSMHGMLEGSLIGGEAGCYRDKQVFLAGALHPFPRPDEVPAKMRGFEEWMREERNILHPVEYAVCLHKILVCIHPFEDGNGRISRLAMNAALVQRGYLPIIVSPVLRTQYIDSLRTAHEDDGPFKEFMYRQVIESQRMFLRLVNGAEPAPA